MKMEMDVNKNDSYKETFALYDYELEYWADGKHADKKPTEVLKKKVRVVSGKPLKIRMAGSGGYVGIMTPVE